ncbi:MAG TPA: DUF1993 domain-containing protein [Polyangiaceae bacterium]|jgi:hypothetical protein|nr:DUF1993 domain-containing protein [Polyangiaceae bacterium]
MMKAFDVSAGMFVRGLGNLKTMLDKAEAHATATGIEPRALLGAQLAGDMNDLASQVHWASEGAKLAVHRLLGSSFAPAAAAAQSFADLHERIDAALAALRAVDPDALEAGLARTIELPHRGATKTFTGERFLTEFAIPNFFFHFTTAYAILRHNGVPLQKGDFLGP